MGDRSMTECLAEQLVLLRSSLPKGTSAQQWYDDGADVTQLQAVGANVNGLRAWGYLEGAADANDWTVMDLLTEHGLTLDAPKPKKAQRPVCPKCGGKVHRCKSGLCLHCNNDDCTFAWIPTQEATKRVRS